MAFKFNPCDPCCGTCPQAACCPDVCINATLYVQFCVKYAGCNSLNGYVLPITWEPDTFTWSGSAPFPGNPDLTLAFTLACIDTVIPLTWAWRGSCSAFTDAPVWTSNVSCLPFNSGSQPATLDPSYCPVVCDGFNNLVSITITDAYPTGTCPGYADCPAEDRHSPCCTGSTQPNGNVTFTTSSTNPCLAALNGLTVPVSGGAFSSTGLPNVWTGTSTSGAYSASVEFSCDNTCSTFCGGVGFGWTLTVTVTNGTASGTWTERCDCTDTGGACSPLLVHFSGMSFTGGSLACTTSDDLSATVTE